VPAGAELELAGKVGREMLLHKALKNMRNTYNYILLDPPPSLEIFAFCSNYENLCYNHYRINALTQLRLIAAL